MLQQVKARASQLCGCILMCVICVSLMAGLSGCEKEKQPLKIGFVGSLTGRYAELGVAGRNGAILAIEQVNEAGGINGRPVELIVKDDKNDPEVALHVDKDLISNGVVAIVGHMTSGMSKTAVPLFNKEKIVMVSPTSTTNELTGLDDYFFRTGSPVLSNTLQCIRYIYNERKIRKLAAVYDADNRVYSEDWYNNAKSEFEKLGGTLFEPVTFTHKKDASFPDIVKKLLDSNPDGILTITGATDTATICQELQKAGSNLPVFNTGWGGTPELIQHGGSAVEGIAFMRTFDEQNEHENYVEFKKKFSTRFNIEPNYAATGGYDSAHVILTALARTDKPENLKEAILSQPVFQARQEDIRIDQFGDPLRQVYIFTVKNGEFKKLKTLE